MIVCHCNVISDLDIKRTVDELLAEDPLRVLTPGLVYMTMGKRGRCCGCFRNAIAIIAAYVDHCHERDDLARYRREQAQPSDTAVVAAESGREPAQRFG